MLNPLPCCPTHRTSRILVFFALLFAGSIQTLHAQEKFTLDTARSEVRFTLADPLHVVHGTFHIQQGEVLFDTSAGKASGAIVVDAVSGQSGNSMRDHRMTHDELKASTFKTISFSPTRITGTLNPTGDSTLQVYGIFTLLNTPHEIELPMQVQANGSDIRATGSFTVPYVQWGLKDPSTFMLHCNKDVQIDLLLIGTLHR
jgi:polyisoprenoid-binding protein YceI